MSARIESITVIKARNVPKQDSKSKTPIFIKVKVGGQEFTTKTIRTKGDPKWNESFRVEGGKLKDIEFELYEGDQSNQSSSAKKIGIAKAIRYEIRDGKESYLLPICKMSNGRRMSAMMSLSGVSQQMSRGGKLSVLEVVIEGNGFTKERVEMVRLLEEEQEERRRLEDDLKQKQMTLHELEEELEAERTAHHKLREGLTAEQMAHHKLEEELTAEQMAHQKLEEDLQADHKLEEKLEAEQMAYHKLREELTAEQMKVVKHQEAEDDLMKKLKFLLKNVSSVGDDEEKVNDLLRRRQSEFERQIMADKAMKERNEVDEDSKEKLCEDKIENERTLRSDPQSISLLMYDEDEDLESKSNASSGDKVPAPAELVSDDPENEKEGDHKPNGKRIAVEEDGVIRFCSDSYDKVLSRYDEDYEMEPNIRDFIVEKEDGVYRWSPDSYDKMVHQCRQYVKKLKEYNKDVQEMKREKADKSDQKSSKSGYFMGRNGKSVYAEDVCRKMEKSSSHLLGRILHQEQIRALKC